MGSIGEHDRRDDVLAVVPLLDERHQVGLVLDVVPLVGDTLVREEALRTPTVAAPARPVHLDQFVVAHPAPRSDGWSLVRSAWGRVTGLRSIRTATRRAAQ